MDEEGTLDNERVLGDGKRGKEIYNPECGSFEFLGRLSAW
jgi:hypothetical protein